MPSPLPLVPSTVFLVDDGKRIYLPYPGGRSPGSREAAECVVRSNRGYKVVEADLVVRGARTPVS